MTVTDPVATLDELAADLEGEGVDAVWPHDGDGRAAVSVGLVGAELDRLMIFGERHNLPPWAEITAVNVLPPDAATFEAMDDFVPEGFVVVVVIQDRRDTLDAEALVTGELSPAEAFDYWAVKAGGYTQSDWSDERGVDQSTVSENVSKAREKLGE